VATDSVRTTGLVTPAVAVLLAWLLAHAVAVVLPAIAVLFVVLAASWALRSAYVRAHTQVESRAAPLLLALLAIIALSSLLLPIWNAHAGLGSPYHAHFILDAGHIH
jgi:hypothetical protein